MPRLLIHPSPPIHAITPNLNRRLSGVTSTIVRLVPIQAKKIGIVSFGLGLPDFIPRLSLLQLLKLGYTKTPSGKPRVFHARRNIEMLLGLFLKHILRHPYKLLFTSASQRKHSAYTKFLIRQMDHVIATSAATAKYLEVENTVILHGIPLEDFAPVENVDVARKEKNIPGDFVIGCFGRIRKQKGTDVFVDAMIDLLPRHPQATAIIMGRATGAHTGFLDGLKAKIKAGGLEERIIFPGEVPVHEIADWYKTLTLFVAPQRWEGFGLTPLEAMGCAIPAIATTVGAFPEIVLQEKTGLLIEPGNVDQMIIAVEKYINNPDMLRAHKTSAHQHVHEKFPIEREADEIIAVYEKLMNE